MRPEFIVVGGHKCGTTALFSLLGSSSGVQIPDEKEPHFFAYPEAEATIPRIARTPDDYAQVFAKIPIGMITGEASVLYLSLHRVVIPRMLDWYGAKPSPLIVIILRNPVDRATSAYFDVHRGNPLENLSLQAALAAEQGRSRDPRLPLTMQYREMGLFADQVEHYLTAFPRVRIVTFDDFVTDPARCAASILGDLGVDPSVDLRSLEQNDGRRAWSSEVYRRLVNASVMVHGRRTLRRLAPGLHGWMRRITMKRLMQRAAVPVEVVESLKEFYKADIVRLAHITGLDLNRWLEPSRPHWVDHGG